MKRLFVAACAAVLVGAGASGALAGELKGPPGGGGGETAALANANSICAASGLNDMNPDQGQIDRQTQTPKDFAPGDAGHGNAFFSTGCRGGSNFDRQR
jgi:hypothetical protein